MLEGKRQLARQVASNNAIIFVISSMASLNDVQVVEVGRSKPVNMPISTMLPILIESGSASSCEQSPKLQDACCRRMSDETGAAGEIQLKEDLADAMLESPGGMREPGEWLFVFHNDRTVSINDIFLNLVENHFVFWPLVKRLFVDTVSL